MKLGTTEIILILVIALLVFGGSKLAGVGGALGKSIKDFKKEIKESKEDDDKKSDDDKKEDKKD